MVSAKIVTASAIAAVGVSAQVDGVISSIVTQISNGLVAGRKSGVPESQASSEIAEIVAALKKNSDVENLLTSAANLVLGGLQSDGIVKLAAGAKASLAAFEGSGDYQTVVSLISAHVSDLDTKAGFASVTMNLAPILNLVIPPISSLSVGDQNVASAVNEIEGLALGLLGKVGLIGGVDTPAATASATASATTTPADTAAGTSTESATSATATASIITDAISSSVAETTDTAAGSAAGSAAGTTASVVASSVATSGSSVETTLSSAVESSSSTSTETSSISQVNGQTTLKGSVFAVAIVAAGALLI